MNVLITGANGFVGRALAARLVSDGMRLHGRQIELLTLADLVLPAGGALDGRIETVCGSIADPVILQAMVRHRPDVVFHLASVTSGLAERDYALGLAVNVQASVALSEILRQQDRCPILVFASSIAVFGASMDAPIDDATRLRPVLSYGVHKVIGELLFADCTRRGFLDGRSVRLPGIVVRPGGPSAVLSAFSSDLIRALSMATSYTCPVSPAASLWLMSVDCCVSNLLHAANPETRLPAGLTGWTLPALQLRAQDLLDAYEEIAPGSSASIVFAPIAEIERQFGSLPRLSTDAADRAGFRHDGDVGRLLSRCQAALNRKTASGTDRRNGS